MDYPQFLPYAIAFVIAIPFLILFRQFVYTYIKLKEKEMQMLAIKSGGSNKLQAYERMVLFMERLKPANLVNKFDKNLKPHEFLFLTEKSISEEYDYNSSQQLYISKSSWQNITAAKNAMIQLAHKTHENLSSEANLEEYKTILLMNYVNGEDFIAQTIDELRKEALILGN